MKAKKNKAIIIVILIVMIAAVVFKCYRMFKDYQYDMWIQKNGINSGIDNAEYFDPDQVLCGVFEGMDYNNLQLTENFKNKYPNREKIVNGIEKYDWFSSGYDDGFIFITANKFDIFGNIKNDDLTLYYFEYSVKDNLLDDVKLIKREIYDPIENVILEEEIYST